MRRAAVLLALGAATAVLLAGCSSSVGDPPAGPVDVVTGLQSPWSILRIDDDTTLISERDSGAIERVTSSGALRKIGTVPGVVHTGEGGLLGLALHDGWLYAYETTADDNRVIRMRLGDDLSLGAPDPVLTGLHKAANHNGGRIAFGPDGMLYATVGDTGDTANAQDPSSLNGKILRMTPAGAVPDDNPFAGSLVYSLGHRNPQGLAWDASGQLFAAEFGQDTWDEFNRIEPGANYGWPVVEGEAHDDRFVDPLLQWHTDQASPSGLSYVAGRFYLAALRGERLWAIRVAADGTASASASLTGLYGRLRDVAAGPGDTLWVLTDNTDGRGTPKPGDDRLLQVELD